ITACAAAALLLGYAVSGWQARHNNPESLLARAYTQSRTMDLRIAGAGFAPVASSPVPSGGGEDSPLSQAQSILASQLKQKPDDPHLLQLEARACLLSGRYDAAINILDPLLAQGPVTAALLTDDASAYFERGLVTGSQNDRATALENLRRAESLDPANSVILFNEAIVLEDSGHIASAMDAWNRYLKIETNPEWLAEGRRRLERLQQLQGAARPQTSLDPRLDALADALAVRGSSAHRPAA
ncbi:MAG TPA: tetratricopeptide repeat protein, partial [Terracidiphilus sp.]|nr:tetratricopeptide repeat protein [Terracidiphilus sp.]